MFHTLRKANSCADDVAKLAAKSDSDLCIWENPPPGVCPLLLFDSLVFVYL
jgi:hypothetical protein